MSESIKDQDFLAEIKANYQQASGVVSLIEEIKSDIVEASKAGRTYSRTYYWDYDYNTTQEESVIARFTEMDFKILIEKAEEFTREGEIAHAETKRYFQVSGWDN